MEQKTKRLLAGITIGGLGVLMLFIALRAATVSVWATQVGQAVDTPVSDAAVIQWEPLLRDNYDGTYRETHTIPRIVGTTGKPYQWGRVTRPRNPFSDTFWCMQGWLGASLIAGTDVYTDGVNTTVTYGPLDLRDVVTMSLSFDHWIAVADGDELGWSVSVAGAPAAYQVVTPEAPRTWETTSLHSAYVPALADVTGQQAVYLSFRFRSNNDGQVDRGVFLDNLELKTKSISRLHFPLVWGPQPTPTPSPTPSPTPVGYYDNFTDVNSGFPREWERKNANENMRGGYMIDRRPQVWAELEADRIADGIDAPDLEAAEARFLGLQDDVYYAVVHDAWDRTFISSPYQVSGDFDLEVRARYSEAHKWFPGNRYGVMVTKEHVNPEDPHSVHGFSFQVEIMPKEGGQEFDTPQWRFKEWYRTNWKGDNAGDEDEDIAVATNSAIHSSVNRWNTLLIQRRGTSFHLFVNGVYVHSSQHSSNKGPFYVGLISRHTGSGATELSYDIVFEWDYIKVTPR